MDRLTPSTFSLLCGIFFLMLAGICELRTHLVPNRLNYTAFLTAVAFCITRHQVLAKGDGGLPALLFCSLLGGLLFFQPYLAGYLGAGCVKAQAAFGAWVGCGFGVLDGTLLLVVATLAAGIFTGLFWILTALSRNIWPDSEDRRDLHGQFPLSIGTVLGALVWTSI